MKPWMFNVLRFGLAGLVVGAVLGQVLAIGVYATKFAGGPEQGRAAAGMALALLTLGCVQAFALVVWRITARVRAGQFFQADTRVWLRILAGVLAAMLLPALAVLWAGAIFGDSVPPVVYVLMLGITVLVAVAGLLLRVGMQAFDEAARNRSELEGVI